MRLVQSSRGRSVSLILRFCVTYSDTNVNNSEILQGGLNITMTIETMAREFRYDGLRLPDPNAKLSVDEVRTAFSATYPEIATASGPITAAVGNKLVYHFTKAIGTKG